MTSLAELASTRRRDVPPAHAVRWTRPGSAELVEVPHRSDSDHGVSVDVSVSVISSGTERARFLQLPNASVELPHFPGYTAADVVADANGTLPTGSLVAARHVGHRSSAIARENDLHLVPPGVRMVDAALWHVGVTALHGLERASYQPGEPVVVVGAGLIGALVRRFATALGSPCLVVARSTNKHWTVADEAVTCFVLADSPEFTEERTRHSLVIDATGAADGLVTAVDLAARNGRVVLLGSPRAQLAPLPIRPIHDRGLRVIGAHVRSLRAASEQAGVDLGAELTERFFHFLSEGVSFADLIEMRAPHDAPEVYRELAERRSAVGFAFDWESCS